MSLLASKRAALFLFFGLAILLVPETIFKETIPFVKPIKFFLLSLIWLNLAACTIKRFKTLQKSTLLIHIGCLVTIIGSLAGHLGYVATINIHEGNSTKSAYRWDLEEESPLGFELKIDKINRQYYPVMVKVGVLDDGKQAGLFKLKTGESFNYKEYKIEVDSIDFAEKSLQLSVFSDSKLITNFDTVKGAKAEGFPLDLILVAFKDPILKRVWADIRIIQNEEEIQGISEVNNPFIWQRVRFYNTATGIDPFGKAYAGIQIVKDPGIPLVYLGFTIILFGCFGLFWKSIGNGLTIFSRHP